MTLARSACITTFISPSYVEIATLRTNLGSNPIFFRMDFTLVDAIPALAKSFPSMESSWPRSIFSLLSAAGLAVSPASIPFLAASIRTHESYMSSSVESKIKSFSLANSLAPSLGILPRTKQTPLNSAICAEMTACWVASPVKRIE